MAEIKNICTRDDPLFWPLQEDSVQHYAVDVAAGEIQHILSGGTVGTYRHNVPPPASITGATTSGRHQQPTSAVPPTSSYSGPRGMPTQMPSLQGGYHTHPAALPHQPGVAGTQQPKPSYSNVPPPGQAYPQQVGFYRMTAQRIKLCSLPCSACFVRPAPQVVLGEEVMRDP